MVVGNFDGKLDLAVMAPYNNVYLLPGSGTGTFGVAQLVASIDLAEGINAQLDALTAADLNRDGKLDLAITYNNGNSTPVFVSTLVNDGTGKFAIMSAYAIGSAYSLTGSVGLA